MFYAPRPEIENSSKATLDILTAEWFQLEGWNHDNLQAPYWRLYWNNSSGAWLKTEAKRIAMIPEKVYLIPPETRFASENHTSLLHFYVHFLTSGDWTGRQIVALSASEGLQKTMRMITDAQPGAIHPWRIAGLVTEALGRLPSTGFAGGATSSSERIRLALRIIESRLPEPVEIATVAKQVGMNLNAFIRRFKEELGETPARYQREKRIAAACLRLHHSADSIEWIAERCGFCDRHHFTRVFTRVRGISPAAFRRIAVKAD